MGYREQNWSTSERLVSESDAWKACGTSYNRTKQDYARPVFSPKIGFIAHRGVYTRSAIECSKKAVLKRPWYQSNWKNNWNRLNCPQLLWNQGQSNPTYHHGNSRFYLAETLLNHRFFHCYWWTVRWQDHCIVNFLSRYHKSSIFPSTLSPTKLA